MALFKEVNGKRVQLSAEEESNTLKEWESNKPDIEQDNLKSYSMAVTLHINEIAIARGYDSALSVVSYAGSKKLKWKGEAVVFNDWRDDCWQYSYDEFEKMEAGTRTWPTPKDFILELPVIAWPI